MPCAACGARKARASGAGARAQARECARRFATVTLTENASACAAPAAQRRSGARACRARRRSNAPRNAAAASRSGCSRAFHHVCPRKGAPRASPSRALPRRSRVPRRGDAQAQGLLLRGSLLYDQTAVGQRPLQFVPPHVTQRLPCHIGSSCARLNLARCAASRALPVLRTPLRLVARGAARAARPLARPLARRRRATMLTLDLLPGVALGPFALGACVASFARPSVAPLLLQHRSRKPHPPRRLRLRLRLLAASPPPRLASRRHPRGRGAARDSGAAGRLLARGG
jgi:hypothetical protein